MFSWFKRKPHSRPSTPPAAISSSADAGEKPYQGMGVRMKVAFANGERTWTEAADLVELLSRNLQQNGHQVTHDDKFVTLSDSSLVLHPDLASFKPIHPVGAQTCTVIHVSHPSFGTDRLFEYQHSTGGSLEESLLKGFDQWRQLDLVVLLDALREQPTTCTAMLMDFPATQEAPARRRRVLLGPVQYMVQRPLPKPANDTDGPHPSFCSCCLFTNTFEAFKLLLQSDGFYAMRFYAARFQDGAPSGDSRINGAEYEPGKAAIRAYVGKWPDQGVEFRKQYVIVQSVPPVEGGEETPGREAVN